MRKILIPLVACLLLLTQLLHAQVPHAISVPFPIKPSTLPLLGTEMMCNNAGTFTLGAFSGQSNQASFAVNDTIFLCFGDQILLDHAGNADLSGDPAPATPPGVGWAFYDCPPSVMGTTLQNIIADPCVWPNSPTSIWVATQQISGDLLLNNDGNLQNNATFNPTNTGKPIVVYFAPITLDNFATVGYETGPSGIPGPCVSVNTSVAFKVAYLNAINAANITPNSGNDCNGRFRLEGGYPELLVGSNYSIDISLQGSPGVKAIIQTPASQWKYFANINFSVPQPGTYIITISDGKSCDYVGQINMSGCDPSDNTVFISEETLIPPGTSTCIPVTVQNFNALSSAAFSINWDPTVLQYTGISNLNPAIDPALQPLVTYNLNEIPAPNGDVGVIIVNSSTAINVTDGEVLFDICFTAIGPLNSCTDLSISSTPTQISVEGTTGIPVAVSDQLEQVCVSFLPVSFVASITDTLCSGQATLTVDPIGGVYPIEVTVTDLGPNPNPFPLGILNGPNDVYTASVGDFNNTVFQYEICVTDDNGNGSTFCDTITVAIPSLGAQLEFTQTPSCNGENDGIVTAIILIAGSPVANPGSNFSYVWTAATNLPNPTGRVQNGVPAGQYSVVITDNIRQCVFSAAGALGEPLPLNDATVTIVEPSCTGISNGSITYGMTGGTPFAVGSTYSFVWTYAPDPDSLGLPFAGGSGQANPFVLNNVKAGFYRLKVTDSRGCMYLDSFQVNSMQTLSIIGSPSDALCNGDSTGSIIVSVTETPASVTPNYAFFWTPNTFSVSNTATSSTYTDLPVGIYSVLAVDGNGCRISDTFDIKQPTPLVLDTVSISNPNCAFTASGSITVITAGGTAAGPGSYTYNWTPSNVGPNLNGLPPGDHSVTVTDLNGCEDSLFFTLLLPEPPQIVSIDSTSIKCGNDGCLEVNSPDGDLFEWSTINGTILDDSVKVCGLGAGEYIIKVTDVISGCITTDTVALAAIGLLAITDTLMIEPSCNGKTDGTLGVTVSGGNAPYTFMWIPAPAGPSSGVLTPIGAGNYAVKIMDSEGCMFSDTFTLKQPPAIVSEIMGITSTTCATSCDGAVTVEAYYGSVPESPGDFTFLWDDGGTDSVRTDLCAGIHSVTISDGNNCFKIEQITIPSPDSVGSNLSTTPVSCFGGEDGAISIVGDGGNGGPYTFLWSNGATTNALTDLAVDDFPNGLFAVTVTDVDGCTGVFADTLTQPIAITLEKDTLLSEPIRCFGDASGSLQVSITGGNAGTYEYVWEDEGGNSEGTASSITMLSSGFYYVTVTDSKGCTARDSFLLIDPPAIQGRNGGFLPLLCNGDETSFTVDTIWGGSGGPYQFSVDFGVRLDPGTQIPVAGGIHVISFFDGKGCELADSSLNIIEPAPITVMFVPDEVEVQLGEELPLDPIIDGVDDSSRDTFLWTSIDRLILKGKSLYDEILYTFESTRLGLTVIDTNGCSGIGYISVTIDPNRNVYVPNVFYPGNPSGTNTHFQPFAGIGAELINFCRIYDRWGEQLYNREKYLPENQLSEGWDGRYKGKYVNPGVYVYIAEVKFLDGRVLLYRGDVTVIR